jgi:hypothetical protein
VLTRYVPVGHDFARVQRDTLAALLNVSERTVTRWTQALKSAELLEVRRAKSAGRPNTFHLYLVKNGERVRYSKGDKAIRSVARLDIPEACITQVGVEADGAGAVDAAAVTLWAYLLRETLENFSWRATRRALQWSRRQVDKARAKLEGVGVLEGQNVRQMGGSEATDSAGNGGGPDRIVQAEKAADGGGPDRIVQAPVVKRKQAVQQLKENQPHASASGADAPDPQPQPGKVELPTAVGSYLKKHPRQRQAFCGQLQDAIDDVGTEPVQQALQELALYIGKVRRSLPTYFAPILQRHVQAHKRNRRAQLQAMDAWAGDYGEARVNAYRRHCRRNWGDLPADWHTRQAFCRWLRERGENPDAIRERRRARSAEGCADFLENAKKKLGIRAA